jgi:hypothetical protein
LQVIECPPGNERFSPNNEIGEIGYFWMGAIEFFMPSFLRHTGFT